LGQGSSLEDALSTIDQVVEGVQAAREVNELAVSMGVDMPISEQVYSVLYEALPPKQAVQTLLARDLRNE
jgi:glycerol-3-phosphate dehydrogenase (NAD(P)+)